MSVGRLNRGTRLLETHDVAAAVIGWTEFGDMWTVAMVDRVPA